jgi:hypothetical protein
MKNSHFNLAVKVNLAESVATIIALMEVANGRNYHAILNTMEGELRTARDNIKMAKYRR